MRIKIIGAGSIGNHLAHGCRSLGWSVTMVDTKPQARKRARDDIYPGRYGAWDEAIRIDAPDAFSEEIFDAVILGTPPDTHVGLALEVLNSATAPKVLLIEKPLCCPESGEIDTIRKAARSSTTRLLVGYNHRLTAHTRRMAELLEQKLVGTPRVLHAGFEEHWKGIFQAHPWLSGPGDSYLGHWRRGGGAGGEHSHALNLWQYVAALAGAGRITEVQATLEIVKEQGAEYDRSCLMLVRAESGLPGSIFQDVVTDPTRKWCRLQGEAGFVHWEAAARPEVDRLTWQSEGGPVEIEDFARTRPGDFLGEISHLGEVVANPKIPSPLSFESGLETMNILAAAHLSSRLKRAVRIDHDVERLDDILQPL